MSGNKKTVLLSAGGTGGHMFPAAALAHELKNRGFQVSLASDRRGERYVSAFGNIAVSVLPAGTLGAGVAGKLKGAAGLAAGVARAILLIGKMRPAAVVGFGGYPSVPAVLAAQILGVPTILHEQNAVLGKANILLARRAKKIALSWPGADETKYGARAVVTGPLVRGDIAALYDAPYPSLEGGLRILVMGGSQGASILGKVIPAALAGLDPGARARLHVVQQCLSDDIETTRKIYRDAGIDARLETFINDVAAQLAAAHLFIGRAGGTVFEVTMAGRPGIYVPYPHHADQQQKRNAARVAEAGGGWVVEESVFTEDDLRGRIAEMLDNPGILTGAAAAARGCAKPDAARKLADEIVRICVSPCRHPRSTAKLC